MSTKTTKKKTVAAKPAAKVSAKKVATTKVGPRFAVAASYTGDCCATPHVWLAMIRAVDAPTAEAMLRKRVVAKKVTCHDVIALPFSPKTKTSAAPTSGHRAPEGD